GTSGRRWCRARRARRSSSATCRTPGSRRISCARPWTCSPTRANTTTAWCWPPAYPPNGWRERASASPACARRRGRCPTASSAWTACCCWRSTTPACTCPQAGWCCPGRWTAHPAPPPSMARRRNGKTASCASARCRRGWRSRYPDAGRGPAASRAARIRSGRVRAIHRRVERERRRASFLRTGSARARARAVRGHGDCAHRLRCSLGPSRDLRMRMTPVPQRPVALWPLPLSVAVLFTVAAHLALWLSIRDGWLEACVPYVEGCTSISRAARHGLGNHVFRLMVLPCAALVGLHWWLAARWLGRGAAVVAWMGAAAAMALALYAAFLGTEGEAYRFL